MDAINSYKQKLFDFAERNAGTARAKYWLAIVAFSEASFFILPPDVMLVAILMYGTSRWAYYASITTIFSVFGGIFGYAIGYLFFDAFGELIIRAYSLEDEFAKVSILYGENAFWTVFISAFTPIPYKIFTITAGFFKIPLAVFVLASTIGRGARFFIVAFIMKLLGKRFLDVFTKYFNIITITIVAVVILILIF